MTQSNLIDGKSVLVTGGTGSFGRQFVRTLLAHYKPARLAVFSRDELKQFEMSQEFNVPEMRYFMGDVRDRERTRMAFRGVDVVIHAAALKHVPAAEYNPMECIRTNVYGAENVISAAIDNEVEHVIALSTDKAVSPINLYGASKLASDKLFIAANNIAGGHATRFSVVRYGNVIGSRGSVLPFFRKLLSEGCRELPVTDPRMTRFWLRLQDGVDFVLQSLERMVGGEVFVPKIPSIYITDLVKALGPDVGIRVVGMRPGEKLHEVMFCREDARHVLDFGTYYVIQPAISLDESLDYQLNSLGESGFPPLELEDYSSGTNSHFLSVDEISALNERCNSESVVEVYAHGSQAAGLALGRLA